ncbi:MAG: YhfC family intramembrane metalloprotease [Oscillospiraceae bacterium]|jgi:uncharacterized membrane protein YhfC|nr:YhfC family intramembrane metalloprotease [Oscillospiraceae bacterium]
MVSSASIAFMAVSALIAFGLPVVLLIAARKKYNAPMVPALVGALVFVLFVLVLEQLLHSVVFNVFGLSAKASPALYVVYAVFAAGIFEETGRFIAFKAMRKKLNGMETGLAFGIGHGGAEAILLVGLTMIGNIVLSLAVNSGGSSVLGHSEQIAAALSGLADAAPVMFLLSGFERVFAIAIQISLSLIVWQSANRPRRIWLFPAAIALHALADIPAALAQVGAIGNMWLTEVLTAALAALVAAIAVAACRFRSSCAAG